MTWIVYLIEQQSTGRRYVGLTHQTISIRFRRHWSSRRSSDYPLYLAMRDGAREDFMAAPLATLENERAARQAERDMMATQGSFWPTGFNRRPYDLTSPSNRELIRVARRRKNGTPGAEEPAGEI